MSEGEHIARLRNAKGMTLAELASRAEMSRTYLWQIEGGRIRAPMGALLRLAIALEVPYEKLRVSAGSPTALILHNAERHYNKIPTLSMLLEEVAELSAALEGKHEHDPLTELIQIGGIALNWIRRITEGSADDA